MLAKKRLSKKTTAVIVVTGVLLAGGGAAYAYWTAGGSGNTGTASVGSNGTIAVDQLSPINGLRPGGPAQVLSGDFDNMNENPIYVTSLTATVQSVTKATGAAAGTCDATDFTITGGVMSLGIEIPVGAEAAFWSGATIQFKDKVGVNQDACKGATVVINYVVA
jgi:hypothetical protein